MLDAKVSELAKDLSLINAQAMFEKNYFSITHDSAQILVSTVIAYKAFIPTQYKGTKVVFIDTGSNRSQQQQSLSLSLDTLIKLDANEFHRIFVS